MAMPINNVDGVLRVMCLWLPTEDVFDRSLTQNLPEDNITNVEEFFWRCTIQSHAVAVSYRDIKLFRISPLLSALLAFAFVLCYEILSGSATKLAVVVASLSISTF